MRKRLHEVLLGVARRVFPRWLKRRGKYWSAWLAVRLQYGRSSRAAEFAAGTAALVRPRKKLFFYPAVPLPAHVVFKLCALLGYSMVASLDDKIDVVFNHMRGTRTHTEELYEIPLPMAFIVNSRTSDVSKHHVESAFRQVFGYDLAVDPTTYEGPMVEKSDENARHDGHVIHGPIAPSAVDPMRVYQRVIRNRSPHDGMVLDHRVPIHAGMIPLVYLKHRPIETRFANTNSLVQLAEPEDVFTAEERGRLIRFADVLGIDYGEFDVLRDDDGRLYVVDVANTPAGPPNGLPEADARRALNRLAASFAYLVERYSVTGSPPARSLPRKG